MWLILITVLFSEKRYEEIYSSMLASDFPFCSLPFPVLPFPPKLDLLQGRGSSQKEKMVSVTESVEQEGFVLLPEGTGYPREKGKGEETFYNPGSYHLIHIIEHWEVLAIIPKSVDALPVT